MHTRPVKQLRATAVTPQGDFVEIVLGEIDQVPEFGTWMVHFHQVYVVEVPEIEVPSRSRTIAVLKDNLGDMRPLEVDPA